MKVICINDTGITTLIKGKEYEATSLFIEQIYSNSQSKYIPGQRRVRIKGLRTYPIYRFICADGSNLETLPIFEDRPIQPITDTKENFTGKYVAARWNGNKLKQGKIYLVTEDFVNKGRRFKIAGFKGMFRSYYFTQIPLSEQRKIKLQQIKGERPETGANIRPFLHYSEREQIKILFDSLSVVMRRLLATNDLKNISIVEQMIKAGKDYEITEVDVENFLKSDIKKLIKRFGFD